MMFIKIPMHLSRDYFQSFKYNKIYIEICKTIS